MTRMTRTTGQNALTTSLRCCPFHFTPYAYLARLDQQPSSLNRLTFTSCRPECRTLGSRARLLIMTVIDSLRVEQFPSCHAECSRTFSSQLSLLITYLNITSISTVMGFLFSSLLQRGRPHRCCYTGSSHDTNTI